MGQINESSLKNWNNGDVMTENLYEQERGVLIAAINDNFARHAKSFTVQNPDGTVKNVLTLDAAVNSIKFKEGSNVILSLDNATGVLTISVAIAAQTVTTAALADSSVTTVKIVDLGISTTKIADSAVTTAKLADSAVTLAKIAPGSFGAAQIANGVIGTQHINPAFLTQAGLLATQSEFDSRGVNPKNFGAVGNGVADDTDAIKAALASSLDVVVLPKGIYKVTSTLTIPRGKTLRGMGDHSSIIHFYGSNTTLIQFEADARYSRLEAIGMYDFGIGNNVGVAMHKNLFCQMNKVYIEDFSTGLLIHGLEEWCATNTIIDLHTFRCPTGVMITANTDHQSNHTVFLGGYIVGGFTDKTGTRAIVLERGDSNVFYGTAVEDYDIGYSFKSTNPGGNAAIYPRSEGCNVDYHIDPFCPVVLFAPFGDLINNLSNDAYVMNGSPAIRGNNIVWDNTVALKMKNDGGSPWDIMWVDLANNLTLRTPSYFPKELRLQVANAANVHESELTILTEAVKVRRYLQLGEVNSLPVASAAYRNQIVTILHTGAIQDVPYMCVREAAGTYAWKTINLT